MAALPGFIGQQRALPLFDASGTITTGGTSQLVMAQSVSRSYLRIQNLDATRNLYFEFGSARATATLTSGVVTSITITNGGKGFTYPPLVEFLGGGYGGNALFVGAGQPGYPAPGFSGGSGQRALLTERVAQGACVLAGGVVTSITINDGGSGYAVAPYVFIYNDPRDPVGCADPFYGSATSGLLLTPYGSETSESSICTTDQIAVYGAGTGQAFTVKYMP